MTDNPPASPASTDTRPTTTGSSATELAPPGRSLRTDGGPTENTDDAWTDDDGSHTDGEDTTDEVRVHGRTGTWANADLQERLQWIALGILGLVAVATLYSFYANVSQFIAIWASRRYEPALQAAFALAVLAGSLAGIARLSKNLN